jgi:hypothetical protein
VLADDEHGLVLEEAVAALLGGVDVVEAKVRAPLSELEDILTCLTLLDAMECELSER